MHCFLVKLGNFDGQLNEHISYANVSLGDADALDGVEVDRPVLRLLTKKLQNEHKYLVRLSFKFEYVTPCKNLFRPYLL